MPDWTHCPGAVPLTNPVYHSTIPYQASGRAKPDVTVESSGRVLSLAGIKVDEIAQLGPNISDFPKDIRLITYHDETYRLAVQGASDPYPFKSKQTRVEAFWRTLAGDVTPEARPAPAILGFQYQSWVEQLNILKLWYDNVKVIPRPNPLDLPWNGFQDDIPDTLDWDSAMGRCARHRRFCVTKKGYMGMVPPLCKPTDVVCIIPGAETPYIIRRSSDDDNTYELVGECYVHGMMDGEMLVAPREVERLVFV